MKEIKKYFVAATCVALLIGFACAVYFLVLPNSVEIRIYERTHGSVTGRYQPEGPNHTIDVTVLTDDWLGFGPGDIVLVAYKGEYIDFDKLKNNSQITIEAKRITSMNPLDLSSKIVAAKPVIYLYPPETTDITVILDYKGTLTTTYPAYGGGWSVTATPDGKLINHADGREYSYLFWEGVYDTEYDFSEGFCVKAEDTAEFLQEILAEIGLLPHEYNEFIVYWLPLMEQNAYNLVSFQFENYTDTAALEISPAPDSMLRVFMAFS